MFFKAFHRHIAPPRFFIKPPKRWNLMFRAICWFSDFPVMQRYSKEFLEQHPELVEVADSASALRAAAAAAALLEEGHRRLHRTSRISGNGSNGISAWSASGWPWRRERP